MSKSNKVRLEDVADLFVAPKKNKNGKSVKQRFNKKKFSMLCTALANDVNFTETIIKTSNGKIIDTEEILVSKQFRKFCKLICERMGVDKHDSEKIMSEEFAFAPSEMKLLYEPMAAAIQEFISRDQYFEFLPTKNFKGSIFMDDVPESETISEVFSPKDRKSLGKRKTKKQAYTKLGVKSTCPSYCKETTKI